MKVGIAYLNLRMTKVGSGTIDKMIMHDEDFLGRQHDSGIIIRKP